MSATRPTAKSTSLAYQYGGNHKRGLIRHFPERLIPYIQLARLIPPAGLFLIYFPHLFGLLATAIIDHSPASLLLAKASTMFIASFFVSSAIHIWNDLIDAPLDALVERTRYRPIPRGAVTPAAAFFFTVSQTLTAAAFLTVMSPDWERNAVFAAPGIMGWAYYPWAKRHTHAPQLVLGFCLSWGVIMGAVAMGVEPFSLDILGFEARPAGMDARCAVLCLFLVNTMRTMIYDTVYAHQDVKDDAKVGIKSLAVLFQDRTKPLLWILLSVKIILLIAMGKFMGMSVLYFYTATGGSMVSLGLMIYKVDLKDSRSCWWWFGNGFWFAGGSIATSLLAEYLARI